MQSISLYSFCILQLCQIHSWVLSFLKLPLGFSRYIVMSFASTDSFNSSFPNWIPFLSFSFLIAMARTYKTMLNCSGESGHPCLLPDLSGKFSLFLSLIMMLAMGLSYMFFIMLRYVPSSPTLWREFIRNWCWILSKAFSTSTEVIIFFFFFSLSMSCITPIDLQISKTSYIPGINPTWSWYMILLKYICIWFDNILLRIFAFMFSSDAGL